MSLVINNLTKKFGDLTALNNLNIELDKGIYGILGPNGSGKSTFINLLTDNLDRTSGDIRYEGTDIIKLGKNFRKKIGYMPQQQGYYDDFSAKAFLMYMAKLKGLSNKEAKIESDDGSPLMRAVILMPFSLYAFCSSSFYFIIFPASSVSPVLR